MKIFNAILLIAAFGLIIYNATMIDLNDPFQGDSTVAIIGVVASLCAILLITILNQSKKIQDRIREKQ